MALFYIHEEAGQDPPSRDGPYLENGEVEMAEGAGAGAGSSAGD